VSSPGDQAMADREIVLTRDFDAPRALVWGAFSDPAQIVRWWGPNGFTTTVKKWDFRVGGEWSHTMHGPDGTDYPNYSKFREIVPEERISYVHGGGREDGPGAQFVATWTFASLGPRRTRVTGRMVFPTAEARDTVVREYGAIEGGEQTLGRLADHLAKAG
jgi:uncharacterized protein YndB with AHSA1/START domain